MRAARCWSWAEIEACHALLYSDDAERPLKAVKEAYARWGGIPRFVLEKINDKTVQDSLDAAIAQSTFDQLFRAVGEVSAAPELSHRLLRIVTARPYVARTISFGSAFIAQRVLEQLENLDTRRVVSFLRNVAHQPSAAGFRGLLFEAHAHRALRAGGEFDVRPLHEGGTVSAPTKMKIESGPLCRVNVAEDLGACQAGAYYQPLAQNFPAVDAVSLPDKL